MTDRELMQQALEALEGLADTSWTAAFKQREYDSDEPNENVERERVLGVITALRERLAQPEQEPDGIGWLRKDGGYFAPPHRTHWEGCEEVHPECRKPEQEPVAWAFWHSDRSWHDISDTEHSAGMKPLYTTPPRRDWVGLTEEEIAAVGREEWVGWPSYDGEFTHIFRLLEAKLKEKNT